MTVEGGWAPLPGLQCAQEGVVLGERVASEGVYLTVFIKSGEEQKKMSSLFKANYETFPFYWVWCHMPATPDS